MDSEVLVFVPLEACLVTDEESLCADRWPEVSEDFMLCCWDVGVGCATDVFVYVFNVRIYGCIVLVF